MSSFRSISIFLPLALLPLINASPLPEDDAYVHPFNGICTDYTVTQDVTSTNYIWAPPKLEDNFDVAALLFNLSRKDSAATFQVFSGTQNLTKSYTVSGTFCTPKAKKNGKENTVLVATHGLGYDRRYWAPSYQPEEYSFVEYALDKGYSTFYYDRVGTGLSEKVSGYENQSSNQIELLAKLIRAIRGGSYTSSIKASKIVLVGHSFGSSTSNVVLAKYPNLVEGAILTGIAYPLPTDRATNTQPFVPEAFALRIAATTAFPPTSPDLDSGYLGFGDIYAHISTFFHYPDYAVPVAEYAHSISQPLAITELLSLGTLNYSAPAYGGNVLVTTGEFDALLCGGECKSTYADEGHKAMFPNAKVLETYVHPGAGHGVNFGRNVTGFFDRMGMFLDGNF